jgi:hypothetical protein
MESEGEGLEGDPVAARDIRAQLSRPEPADSQVVMDEGAHRVRRSEFPHWRRTVNERFWNNERFAVAPGDDQVTFVRGDKNLFGMLEVEVQLWKKGFQRRLIADPDRALRQGIRSALNDFGTAAGHTFHVAGKVVGGAVDFLGWIFHRHDDWSGGDPLRHPDHAGGLG